MPRPHLASKTYIPPLLPLPTSFLGTSLPSYIGTSSTFLPPHGPKEQNTPKASPPQKHLPSLPSSPPHAPPSLPLHVGSCLVTSKKVPKLPQMPTCLHHHLQIIKAPPCSLSTSYLLPCIPIYLPLKFLLPTSSPAQQPVYQYSSPNQIHA